MAELFYISDKAYATLVTMAMSGGFVSMNAQRMHGMSKFIIALSRRQYTDTRPDFMKADDEYLISMRHTPTWIPGEQPRKSRGITINQSTLVRLGVIALEHRIFIGRYYKGGPMYNSPVSIAGAVLEAIGLNYLTPDVWPRDEGYFVAQRRIQKLLERAERKRVKQQQRVIQEMEGQGW